MSLHVQDRTGAKSDIYDCLVLLLLALHIGVYDIATLFCYSLVFVYHVGYNLMAFISSRSTSLC